MVADKRPDWRLRLYGGGSEEKRLRALVAELSLHNHVYFMGTTPDLPGEFAKASIVAVTSRREVLGMAVNEALSCGVPIVGFDGAKGWPSSSGPGSTACWSTRAPGRSRPTPARCSRWSTTSADG